MMNFTRQVNTPPRVNLSALIDVAFILVIFIVLTATYREDRDVSVELPKLSDVPQNELDGLTITIRADGSVELEGRILPRDQLIETLRELHNEHDSVLLLADAEASVEVALQVLADAQAAGFTSAAFGTKERSEP